MSDDATKDDLKQLRRDVREDMDQLRRDVREDMDQLRKDVREDIATATKKTVDELSEVIQQLAFSMSEQIREVKTDIADIRASIDRLTNTMDKFVARLDAQELETAAQDSRFEKLLDWAREVSKKTGIPLKDL